MTMTTPALPRHARHLGHAMRRPAQRGVTLLFALIALVLMLLATLALIRSVDTSTLLMGNIGFKQDATATADQATKVALTWISSHGTVLNSDSLTIGQGQGYYASTKEYKTDNTLLGKPVDATGQQVSDTLNRQLVDWTAKDCASGTDYPAKLCSFEVPAASIAGPNSARYIIFRLCSQAGDYTASGYTGTCAKWSTSGSSVDGAKGAANYANGGGAVSASAGPYYRIVVRVQGARNTTSFTETIVHF
jgi:type IV pilus assembly protein PilX